MASRSARAVAALCCVVLAGACSGIPDGSPAHVVRRVPAEGPEPPPPGVDRRLPAKIPANATPDDIVRAFLHAQGEPAGDFALARRHLARNVDWDASGRTVVYASREIGKPAVSGGGTRASVTTTLRPVGTISPSGEFRPRSAPVSVTFRLQLVAELGWRLAEAPSGLLLSRADVASSFQRATLYWPDASKRLVPDPVFVRTPDQPVATLVRALLLGPTSWLAPSVRTAIPSGTELLEARTLGDGVLSLNFSREIRGAPRETLGTLVAQVVWTLTERSEVQAVRLLAEGDPITVPERPELRDHRRLDWAAYSPVPTTADRRLFFVADGAPSALDDGGRLSRLADTPPLASLAVNRAGTRLAAVTRPVNGRQSLLVVELTGAKRTRTVLTADRLGAPTWEANSDTVWVVQTNGAAQQVVAAPAVEGQFTVVPVPAALPAPITSLRLSPDGARAAIVAGAAGDAALFLARVEHPASGGRGLGDPLRVVQSVRGVTAVAFDGPVQLLLASRAGRRVALHRVDLDGFALEAQRATGLPAGPVTALSVSSGTPADRVASAADRLWRRTPNAQWAALRYGDAAAATFAG